MTKIANIDVALCNATIELLPSQWADMSTGERGWGSDQISVLGRSFVVEISKYLEGMKMVAFGKIGHSPFKYRSIPGGDPECGLLLATERLSCKEQGAQASEVFW